jgi:hypothetical protein
MKNFINILLYIGCILPSAILSFLFLSKILDISFLLNYKKIIFIIMMLFVVFVLYVMPKLITRSTFSDEKYKEIDTLSFILLVSILSLHGIVAMLAVLVFSDLSYLFLSILLSLIPTSVLFFLWNRLLYNSVVSQNRLSSK